MENSLSFSEYTTGNLYLAAWLITRKAHHRRDHQLTFLRVQDRSPNNTAKVFVFADPERRGLELEREFMTTNPVVRIHTYRAALNLLRDHLHGGKPLGGGQ